MEQIAWVVAVLRSRWDRKVIQRLDVTGSHQQLQAGRTKGGCRTTRAQARATQQKLDLPNRSRNDGGDRSERLADFPGAFFPPSLPVPSTGKTQAEGGLCRSRAGNREETGVQASRRDRCRVGEKECGSGEVRSERTLQPGGGLETWSKCKGKSWRVLSHRKESCKILELREFDPA